MILEKSGLIPVFIALWKCVSKCNGILVLKTGVRCMNGNGFHIHPSPETVEM